MGKDVEGLTFFDGAASGQQKSALMRIAPTHVMISYATQNNRPWDNAFQVREDYTFFADSGGFHHMASGTGEYRTPNSDYLDYVEEHKPTLWALRDYPCEPQLLDKHGRTVREHQRMTTERHIELLDAAEDRGTPGQPVAVVQGYTVGQYLSHFDELADHGCLPGYVGVGTLCRKNQDHEIAQALLAVRKELGHGPGLHAFGVKKSALRFEEVVRAVTSADSQAFDWAESRGHGDRDPDESYTYVDALRAYLPWRRDLVESVATESLYDSSYQAELAPQPAVADGGFSIGEEVGREGSL